MAEVNGLEEHLLTIEELLREGGGGEPTNLNIQNGEADGSLKQKVHSPSLVDGAVVNPSAQGLNSTALGTSSVDALTAINEYGGFALTSLAPVGTVTSAESLPEPGTAVVLGTIYRVNDTQNNVDDLYIAVEVDGTPDWVELADYVIEVWGSLDPNKFALALGETSTVTGHNCIALRKNASAQGNGCVASGHSAVARGTGSHALGDYSVAEGLECVASAKFSHSSGDQTEASGRGAHSDGIHTTASGQFSETSGYYTTASNYYAHAEGESTTASGRDAHAEGLNTLAYGDHSHAEGAGGIARGNNSHSEGWHATGIASAVGGASHAEGDSTVSTTYSSHAEGYATKTAASSNPSSENFTDSSKANYEPNVGQHVAGRYNVQTTGARVTGNGTADGSRSNAEVLDWNGNLSLAGNLTLGMGGSSATLTPAMISQIGSGGTQLYKHEVDWNNDGLTYILIQYVSTDSTPVENLTTSESEELPGIISIIRQADTTGSSMFAADIPYIEYIEGDDDTYLNYVGYTVSSNAIANTQVQVSTSELTDTVTAL